MRKVAESTIRRLSLYLRFLEEFEGQGVETVSSGALASRGGTTSAQVRKDLSFFGSFGKRGLGYAVPELAAKSSEIAFLDEWMEEVRAKRPLSKLEIMQREMETAVQKELYERAAELRDAIRQLKASEQRV